MPDAGEMYGGNVFHAGEKGQRVLLQILRCFLRDSEIPKNHGKSCRFEWRGTSSGDPGGVSPLTICHSRSPGANTRLTKRIINFHVSPNKKATAMSLWLDTFSMVIVLHRYRRRRCFSARLWRDVPRHDSRRRASCHIAASPRYKLRTELIKPTRVGHREAHQILRRKLTESASQTITFTELVTEVGAAAFFGGEQHRYWVPTV